MKRFSWLLAAVLGFWLSLSWTAPLSAQIPGLSHLYGPCPSTPFCGSNCSNVPFRPTECKTTEYGAAKADIVIGANALQSTNMLYCPGGTPYALCFFSGPLVATGKAGQGNKVLPCTVIPGTQTANCACEVFTTGSYYVDMNGILNLGAWYETVAACGTMGENCKNIANCDTNGNSNSCVTSPTNPCPPCPTKVAPVCNYIAAQSANTAAKTTFYPQPDLISTFSFAMGTATPGSVPYQLGSSPCKGTYAGCMTAPCNYLPGSTSPPKDGDTVNCACPLWNGDYQIGQTGSQSPLTCPTDTDGWVWSAANAVNPNGN